MALKSRVQSLDYATTVTKCDHPTADLFAVADAIGNGARLPDGVTFLGSGIAKVAVALSCGEHVLKYDAGGSQSRDELRVWNEASPSLRRILAPIYAASSDGRTLIVARATVTPPSGNWEAARKFDRLVRKAEAFGISDLHGGNVGVIDGRCVVIDYGFTRGIVRSTVGPTSDLPDDDDDCETCPDCGQNFTCCADDHNCPERSPSPLADDCDCTICRMRRAA